MYSSLAATAGQPPSRSSECEQTHLGRVHLEPIVRLAEIIEDDATAVMGACTKHNAGRRICLGGDPGTMEGIHDEHQCDDGHKSDGHLALNAAALLFQFLVLSLALLRRRFEASGVDTPDILGQQMRYGNAREHTHYRCQHKHQTHHDPSKIDASHTIQYDKDIRVGQTRETKVEAGRKQEHKNLQMETKM